jgi:hypothetical protein
MLPIKGEICSWILPIVHHKIEEKNPAQKKKKDWFTHEKPLIFLSFAISHILYALGGG